MAESQYAMIQIPYQIIHLDLIIEVEHPLRIPCELVQEMPNLEHFFGTDEDIVSSSILRLVYLSNRLAKEPDKLVQEIPISTKIVRDMIKGHFWPIREITIDPEEHQSFSNVKIEPRIVTQNLDSEKLSEMIEPVKGYLAKQSEIDRDELIQHIRIEQHKLEIIDYSASQVRLISSIDGRKQWIYDSGSFGSLIPDFIETVPGFQPVLPPIREIETDYPLAPEVEALISLRKTRSFTDRIELGKIICKNLPKQITEEQNSRLESIQTIVGSAKDMWDFATQVIKTSNKSALLLSSFTNTYRLDYAVEQITQAKLDSDLEQLYISIGEPDRTSGIDYMQDSIKYLNSLKEKLSPKISIIGGVSQVPNHVKLVISDTGWILLTSNNLLSSSPENFVLESGTIIKDTRLAQKLIRIVVEEKWIPNTIVSQLTMMQQKLYPTQYTKPDTTIIHNKLEKTYQNLNVKNSKKQQFALTALENQLQKIAERPRYNIILNEQHRSILFDSTRRFYERLILASDGLRESGLDKAVINSIKQRTEYLRKNKHKKPTIQIWWGRNAPGSQPIDGQDIKEREQAKQRLELLREIKTADIHPRHSNEPMETHAKLILIDDCRLILTSDNFMAFGDPEFYQGDAGELGLLIDHPRISRQMRGQMELWLQEARENNDLTRWGAAIADEIYYQSYSPFTVIPLENAIKELLLRVLEISSIKEDWNYQFNNLNHQTVIQTIVNSSWNNGGIIGLFHASGAGAGQKSISVEQTLVSLGGDPIWREYTFEEDQFSIKMKNYLKESIKEKAKNYPLTPKEFSQALITEMKNPYDWNAFTSVYGNILQKNYLYNLRLRNEKPAEYLQKCLEYLEIDIRAESPWIWIRKRSVDTNIET